MIIVIPKPSTIFVSKMWFADASSVLTGPRLEASLVLRLVFVLFGGCQSAPLISPPPAAGNRLGHQAVRDFRIKLSERWYSEVARAHSTPTTRWRVMAPVY
jgi:hypothetical protein